MAANAYSITHAPTHQRVGPVTEAITALRAAERAPFEGRGCIILGGELIVYEVGPYPREGDPILVVYGDGRVEVAAMPPRNNHWRSAHSPNALMIACDKPYARGARVTGEEATLIGVVRS